MENLTQLLLVNFVLGILYYLSTVTRLESQDFKHKTLSEVKTILCFGLLLGGLIGTLISSFIAAYYCYRKGDQDDV